MPSNPIRYFAGISTYQPNHILLNYPAVPAISQSTYNDDLYAYVAGNYTVTTGGTSAGVAGMIYQGGGIALTAGSSSPYKALIAGLYRNLIYMPGQPCWVNTRLAVPIGASMAQPCSDAAVYAGLFDTADPSTASNGVYFVKPSGGSAVNFVILVGGTSTTFQNVGDLQYNSGLYNDTASVPGTLTFNTSGTTFTNVTVGTSGAGYAQSPLVLAKGTAGSGAIVSCNIANASGMGTSLTQMSGSLYAPYIQAPGSGYTAGTLGADVVPWNDFSIVWDGKNRLQAGINGRLVLGFDLMGLNSAASGGTYNVATLGPSFTTGATVTTGVSPVQPAAGNIWALLPKMPLQFATGIIGTTANNRVVYCHEINLAIENN